ncbi:MAG: hypothetical protein MUO21_06580, partial [Nitrososphaeraceae archaeon]|nr:hypothetical protein [Nitrososphaeraceae archaeon]
MSLKRELDKSYIQEPENKKIRIEYDELVCPITKEIFNRPVTTNDGFTYEEWSIRQILDSDN